MADDPERPIEKLLRACAEKRRRAAGPPFELHPVNRRLLQDEVARTFGDQSRSGHRFPFLSARFWRRWAWGFAALAALGLIVRLMLPATTPSRPSALLAKSEKLPAIGAPPPAQFSSTQPAGSASAPAETSAPAVLSKLVSADVRTDAPRGLALESEFARVRTQEEAAIASRVVLPAEPAGAASAPSSTSFPFAGQPVFAQDSSATRSMQQFVQIPRDRAAAEASLRRASPATSILASFRVEQRGPEVRVIDHDGSVYTGSVELAQAPAAMNLIPADKAAPLNMFKYSADDRAARPGSSSRTEARAVPNYLFRVTGTNISLSQQVVFSGQMTPLADAAPRTRITNGVQTRMGASPVSPAGQALPSLPDCRISGTAVIGDGREILINAVPSK